MKRLCLMCKTEKEESFFSGTRKKCKSCRTKKWKLDHPEQVRQQSKEYYRKNKDKENSRLKKWQIENKEKFNNALRNSQYKRRSKTIGSFSEEEWKQLCEKYNNMCLCCGRKVNLTRDHVVPLSVGGLNVIENIQPLCRSCNSKKKAKTIDYRISVGNL